MINLIDIQNHITKRLKNRFPDYEIRVEDNLKDVKTPAFYVSVRPILTTGAMNYKNKIVNVNIMYISKDRTNKENMAMTDMLEDLFYLVLRVGKRKLYIRDMSISELDMVLNCGFTLDYNVDKNSKYDIDNETGYGKDAMEYMKKLYLKELEGDDY